MEEWNGVWKKNLVWDGIWNGRNFAGWNMEKSSSIPFHSMPRLGGSGGMLPRKVFENLHTVVAILALFEPFSGIFCLNFWLLITKST